MVDVVERQYVRELFSRDPSLAHRFYYSLARSFAEALDALRDPDAAAQTPRSAAAASAAQARTLLELAHEHEANDAADEGGDAHARFCARFELPADEFVLACHDAQLVLPDDTPRSVQPDYVSLYVTPLYLCYDGDCFGVHVQETIPLDSVDEFDVDDEQRAFALSWTVLAAPPTSARHTSGKKKRQRQVRKRAQLVVAANGGAQCLELVRVVVRHAAEQRARRRKFATRGALLDELLLHHRELARQEAIIPRDRPALCAEPPHHIFSRADCEAMAGAARVLVLRQGETLIDEGRCEQRWYQVVRGVVEMQRTAVDQSTEASSSSLSSSQLKHSQHHHKQKQQRQRIFGRVRARDTFGEASFVLARPSPFSYVAARDDTVVYVLDAASLQEAFAARRSLAGRFFCYAASRIADDLASTPGALLARFRPEALDDIADDVDNNNSAASLSAATSPRQGTLTRFATPASIKQVYF